MIPEDIRRALELIRQKKEERRHKKNTKPTKRYKKKNFRYDPKAIVQDYLDGLKIEEIAKKHDISTATVCRVLKAANLPERRGGGDRPSMKRSDIQALLRYYKGGKVGSNLRRARLSDMRKYFGLPTRYEMDEETKAKIISILEKFLNEHEELIFHPAKIERLRDKFKTLFS